MLQFHFDQSKARSEIRLREGRIKPIDILSKHLDPSDDFDIEIDEPYLVFQGLTVKDMEELHEDIKMHLDLDRATPTHIQYWEVISLLYTGCVSETTTLLLIRFVLNLILQSTELLLHPLQHDVLL